MFINYQNQQVTINRYRAVGAEATDFEDIIDAIKAQSGESLTAYISSEAERIAAESIDPSPL